MHHTPYPNPWPRGRSARATPNSVIAPGRARYICPATAGALENSTPEQHAMGRTSRCRTGNGTGTEPCPGLKFGESREHKRPKQAAHLPDPAATSLQLLLFDTE
jgi:hypothetical protein